MGEQRTRSDGFVVGAGHRGSSGLFRENDVVREVREVLCMVREVQNQLGNLQREVIKVLR